MLQRRALLALRNSGGALCGIAVASWLGLACGAAIVWTEGL